MRATVAFLGVIVIACYQISLVLASPGDSSQIYQKCVKTCNSANCTQDGSYTEEGYEILELSSKLLRWGCQDECRYHCMWKTADSFQESGDDLPKFHGKWPFHRFHGIREPASAFCSLLNLASTVYMHYKMASQFSFENAPPLLMLWHGVALVSENMWIWSIFFHIKDTPLTEFMDYTCALSTTMTLLATAVIRVLHGKKTNARLAVLGFMLWYYAAHVRYLYQGRFDYGFNFTITVVFGLLGGLVWALWATSQLTFGGERCVSLLGFVCWLAAALLVEMLDFPPVGGWDAHALWHLATAPLPLMSFQFVIDDLEYLQSEKMTKEDAKKKTS